MKTENNGNLERFRPYNPNPHGKRVGDCVIRAISKAMGLDWQETYLRLCIEGYVGSDLPSSNAVWGRFLLRNGFKREVINSLDYYTVLDFCIDNPQGVFVLGTGTHVVAVESGCFYDSWDSGSEEIIDFYRKEE
jgi:hypothetical protein